MSEIYVKAAATLHELFAQRKEIAAQAGKKLRSSGKNAKKKMRTRWERAQGYLLSALLGSILTLIAVNGYVGKMDSIHDTAAEDSEAEQQRAITLADTVTAAALRAGEEELRDREADAMARVLYGTAQRCGEEARRAICWCIINRCESPIFPDSIEGVCAQEAQWMGYSAENPVIEELYDTARGVVDAWHDGGRRMIGTDFLYMSWEGTTISLRTSFEEGASTRYWHG